MMGKLWRRIRSEDLRSGRVSADHTPTHDVVWSEFQVSGEQLVEACKNYHEATLDYMIGLGLYRQIRVDRKDHKIRLLSMDSLGTVANRAQGHRVENIYTIAAQLRVGSFNVFSAVCMLPVLASDFDDWMGDGGGRVGVLGAEVRVQEEMEKIKRGDYRRGEVGARHEVQDAHGRKVD